MEFAQFIPFCLGNCDFNNSKCSSCNVACFKLSEFYSETYRQFHAKAIVQENDILGQFQASLCFENCFLMKRTHLYAIMSMPFRQS